MEKLETSQKAAMKVMSGLRLSMKLLEAAFNKSQIQAMDRGQIMCVCVYLFVNVILVSNTCFAVVCTERYRMSCSVRKISFAARWF